MPNEQFFQESGLTYTIGSHMYGLTTDASDIDLLTVYFDAEDYLRPYKHRLYPEVKETHGNNVKLYSLSSFADLIVKGNPNLIEVVSLSPSSVGKNSTAVVLFMNLMRNTDSLVHDGVARAYMGHLAGIIKELDTKGVTPKRLSHALRVVYSVEHIVKTQTLFRLPEHEEKRLMCLDIKTATNTGDYETYVRQEIERLQSVYTHYRPKMRNNSEIKREVIEFFPRLFTYHL